MLCYFTLITAENGKIYYLVMIKKIITTLLGLLLGLMLFAIGLLAIAILVTYPKLPALDAV